MQHYSSLTNLIVYAVFVGPPLLLIYRARPRRAQAVLGLLLLAAVVKCNHQLPAYLHDHVQFERREAAQAGLRVYERIPRPEGIVVAGGASECEMLVLRKAFSYCDEAAYEDMDARHSVQRYRMLEGHAACAGARAAFERRDYGNPSINAVPAIAFDICLSKETRAVSDAPVLLRFPRSPGDIPGPPVFASVEWSLWRSELLARDPAAPRLLASIEGLYVSIPALPVVYRPEVGHGIGVGPVTRTRSYGPRGYIGPALLTEMFGVAPDAPLPEPVDAIQRLIGNLEEGPRLRREVVKVLAARLASNRGDGAPPLDPAWLPIFLRVAEVELAEETEKNGSALNGLMDLIGAYGPQAKAARPLVLAALDRQHLQSHALRAGLAVGLFDQGDIPRLEHLAERGEGSAQPVAEEALQALGAPPSR